MAGKTKKKKGLGGKTIADNRKARRNYEISENFEAGLQLLGTEVKSMRHQTANIAESYAEIKDNELWLVNSNIPVYEQAANRMNHEPRRPRKLLMHRREINRLKAAIQRKGLTVVPLRLYFNDKGRVKIDIALAKGRKLHDKRQVEKSRDWQRDKARLMREKG